MSVSVRLCVRAFVCECMTHTTPSGFASALFALLECGHMKDRVTDWSAGGGKREEIREGGVGGWRLAVALVVVAVEQRLQERQTA